MNILWWIRGRSHKFKPFMANRVGKIQSCTNPEQWRYIPTNHNPADMLSRGMKSTELVDYCTRWRGPQFLTPSEETWPVNESFEKPSGDTEMKKQSRLNQTAQIYKESERTDETNGFVTIAEHTVLSVDPRCYSSWLKLSQIQSWINRFIQNYQRQNADRTSGELLADELKKAEIQLVRYAQSEEFQEEWTALFRGRSLPAHSKLLRSQPKLEDDGLLCSD